MAREIVIHRDDILWHFYCKRFTLEGKEVEPPSNLCPYFWTAITGMVMTARHRIDHFAHWLGNEVPLRRLWLFFVASLIAMVGVARFPWQNGAIMVLAAITALVFAAAYLAAAFVSLYRLARFVVRRLPWVPNVLAAVALVFGIIFGIYVVCQGATWSETGKFFNGLFRVFKWIGILSMLAILVGTAIAFIPPRRRKSIARFAETVVAYAEAKYEKVCPPVTAPADLKAKSLQCLVVPRVVLERTSFWRALPMTDGTVAGAIRLTSQEVQELLVLIRQHGTFMERKGDEGVEYRPEWQQIIFYGLIVQSESFLVYQRSETGCDEERLRSKLAVGIGGHIEPFDSDLQDSLMRELGEEITLLRNGHEIPFAGDIEIIGLIKDDRDDVGKVHLGLACVVRIHDPSITVTIRGDENSAGWMTTVDNYTALAVSNNVIVEGWTELFVKTFIPAVLKQ